MLWSMPRASVSIQIVLDKKLLQATDRVARRTGQSRSSLVRQALREHLETLDVRAHERSDREGYLRQPQTRDEVLSGAVQCTR
jgi:metal-responsive CopG/Arc/MetJ family transcriptional regulator